MSNSNAAIDRISLCMIVRNESKTLARCLASARPWVGEMVVVDTGSTDETVAIARAHGAVVHHFSWCDDFAAARNAALEAATREWALVIDADEELVVEDAAEWRQAVQQDAIAGFSLRIHNLLDNGQTSKGTVFRLFRRVQPGMRYRGEIHEQVIAVSEGGVPTATLVGAYLRHDGYTRAAVNEKDKAARNLSLTRKLVASRPEDPFAWYTLGLALRTIDLNESMNAYEKARQMWDATGRNVSREGFMASLYIALVEGLRLLNQPARAIAAADRGVELFPHSPDLRHLRGQLRARAEDFKGAEEDFAACLAPEARSFFLIMDPGNVAHTARTSLALAWLNLGKNVEAEQLLQQAVAESPADFGRAHRLLGTQLLQRGEWAAALPLLQRGFAVEPEEARFGLGWCYYKLEQYEEAADVLQPLVERPEVQHLLGKVHLEAGDGKRALELLEACSLPSAGLARGWALYVTGDRQRAATVWEEWLRAGAADWGTKDTLAMFLFLLEGGKPPKGQPERPAEPLRDMNQWFRLLIRHRCFNEVERAVTRGPQLNERIWWPLRRMFGATLLQEGFYDVGLEVLLQAQADEPEEAEIYYWLGYASLHKQMVEDARVMWEACLRLSPGHALATQGLGLLAAGRA